MKKMKLWLSALALLTIMNPPLNAESSSSTNSQNSTPSGPPTTTSPVTNQDATTAPTISDPTTTDSTTPSPSAPATPVSPSTPETLSSPTAPPMPSDTPLQAPASNAPTISSQASSSQALCKSPEVLSPASVQEWAQRVAIALFTYDPNLIKAHLDELQPCFTIDGGWASFTKAFEDNRKVIEAQQYTVSSSLGTNDKVKTNLVKGKWEVLMPLQVVYKNNKCTITQLLNVKLVLSPPLKKSEAIGAPSKELDTTSNELRITQILATVDPSEKPSPCVTTPSQESNSTSAPPADSKPQDTNPGSSSTTAPSSATPTAAPEPVAPPVAP